MDALYAKGKSAEELNRHYAAVIGVHTATPLHLMPDDHAFALLDSAGADMILGFMSMGWTGTEIASHMKVPAMAYARWVEKRLGPDDLRMATRNFADALVTRAMYLLGYRATSPQEASSMKELARMARDLAACASPDQWMPAKISGAGVQPTTPAAIYIDINPPSAQGPSHMAAVIASGPSWAGPAPHAPRLVPVPGLPPSDLMPPPMAPTAPPAAPVTPEEPALPTMGWIFGDVGVTAPSTGAGYPPTRERPNG